MIKWVWILGGEPLQNETLDLIHLINTIRMHNKPIVLFTSFELDEVHNDIKDKCDFIKTGRYDITKSGEKEQYGIKLQSTNQRIWRKEKNEWIVE